MPPERPSMTQDAATGSHAHSIEAGPSGQGSGDRRVLVVPPAERPPAIEDPRLSQIRARDPKAEGLFWYSVVTTGIFCRPTCPSRFALVENIRFHDTLAEARATGFRPCRRCSPEEPSLQDRTMALIETACRRIDEDPRMASTLVLAPALGIGRSQLHRHFRRLTGMTPGAYARLRASAAAPGEKDRPG